MAVADRGFEALSPAECLRLLETHTVGRVVYSVQAMPAVTPVNYAMDGRSIVFRTVPGSRLANATRNAVVAFEVDDVDEDRRTGWSVVVTGVANAIEDVGELVRAEALNLVAWAPGDRRAFVRVVPSFISGRALVPVRQPVV